ncbi:anti-sigma factor [Marinobacter lutaoensis]|jgi:sigma-E factor negative regulatory protein RseA|uniref:Anti-sigma factor n=1 Tax=Marinobacter lutaoensis TaxID=135739 RepID=A0A1V2DQC3_9GAMM|nr:sigma-E factor negative regulatory protein [Marinobacter lutaoensis]ONF42837.1 anti-sigma factor [Marinobacter lutaoensis]
MDDRLRETLSAMMDDEADELSVRRLLSYPEQNQVREQWRRWQQIRDLMHGGHGPAEGMDVSASVRAVLDGRSGAGPESAPARRAGGASWHWPVVAMVTLALVIGFGAGAGWESGGVDGPRVAAPGPGALPSPVAALPEPAVPDQEVALQGLDEEQWELMSRYLLEHAQHNSVGAGRGAVGYARVVSAGHGY